MRRSHLLRETVKWVIPIIVVAAVSITLVQAQSGVPLVTSESALSTPTVVVLSAASASTPTIPQGPLATPGVVDSTEKAKGPNGAPSANRTVLHVRSHLVANPPAKMPNGGSSNESWFDVATGQGRYEDIVHDPEIHQVTIYDTNNILYLNLLGALYEQTTFPRGSSLMRVYDEATYRAGLSSGYYTLLGIDEVDGKRTAKVGVTVGSAESSVQGRTVSSVFWLDAVSFLPVKRFQCVADPRTGELTFGLGGVYDIAEWIPRSDLPADFFDQTPPGGFRAGKVPKG